MNNEKILKAAKCCTNRVSCKDCPICNDEGYDACMIQFANYIVEKEKEPAPVKTGTSTKDKTLHLDDTTLLKVCQEAAKRILSLEKEFDNAPTHEQRENLLCLIAAKGTSISKLLLKIGGE